MFESPTHDAAFPMPVLPLRERESLAGLAYESIVEAIFDGRLDAGAPLTIDALARQLAMSNTPVREALTRLAAERLVVFSANRGFTVAPRLTSSGYHHLFDTRYLIEIRALETATIERAVADRIAGIVAEMDAAGGGPDYRDYRSFHRADRAFHRALVAMSGNEFLLRAWTDLHFHLHVARLYGGAGVIDHDEASAEHRALVDALRAGNRDELVRLDALHIARAEERLERLLAREPAERMGG